MGTTIAYNGNTLTTLEGGQIATLGCAGKKATGAISIVFDNKGNITYKGVTTEIEAGKTANLLCAGKKFATDVVVAVEKTPLARTLVTSDGYYLVASDGTILMVKE